MNCFQGIIYMDYLSPQLGKTEIVPNNAALSIHINI